MKYPLNYTVITISTVHAPGRRQIIRALELYACDLLALTRWPPMKPPAAANN